MTPLTMADLVVIAAEVLGSGTGSALDLLDVDAAQAALSEVTDAADPAEEPAQAAAVLLDALIRHRPFRDGNTQVAVLATLQFLAINGWRADLDPPEAAEEVVRGLAGGRLGTGDVAAWLAPRLSATQEETMPRWRRRRARTGVGFDRFTDRARRSIVLAEDEARRLHHNYIGTEHLLLGLLGERDGVAARVLVALGISGDAARRRVLDIIGEGRQEPIDHIPFTPRAKKVIDLAADESRRLGHLYVGTEHLLLALVREGSGVAAQVLRGFGAGSDQLRAEVLRVLAGHSRRDRSPGDGTDDGLRQEIARLRDLLRQHGIEPDEGDQRSA